MSDEDKRTRRVTPASSRPRNVTFERSQHPSICWPRSPADYGRRQAPRAESGPMTKATVANRKRCTCRTPPKKHVSASILNKKQMFSCQETVICGPGTEIELPASEIARLDENLGFVVRPSDSCRNRRRKSRSEYTGRARRREHQVFARLLERLGVVKAV